MSQAPAPGNAKRTSLLTGCGSAALAMGLILGPAPAAAQGIQADGNVVFGSAGINQTGPNQTTVAVSSQTTVIDWTPLEDAAGNALDFLPTGSTAFFENNSSASFVSDFAVLNRILPSTNGNVAVINGSVISRIVGFTGVATPGGFIAFYSPTGILVGSGASFDVGRLLLTTLDTTPENFRDFYQQGATLQLRGATRSTARISIQPNARISALRENGFFAVVAADVEMLGIARINGSHAYVAGEAVNLTFSNGLFNITIPTGTAAAGEVMTLDGTIGGPASTGVNGDNHLIYAVARASQDPISMLFRGNLGFDPAQSAGIINGEIILAANYDVFGRNVNGGSISNGVNGTFGGDAETSLVRANIAINDANVTGNLLAISSHAVSAAAVTADSSFLGDLLLVGRESASLSARNGNDLTVNGNVLVDARDYGASGSFLQTIDQANAASGSALIESVGGGTLRIGRSAKVLADAFAGAQSSPRIAGSAIGGSAAISAEGGVVDVSGTVEISARGIGATTGNIITGADSRGGSAELRARAGGTVLVGQTLTVEANAVAANGSLISTSTASNAYAGTARIAVRDGGGTITVGGDTRLNAIATGGSANAAGAGSVGDAGEATVSILESGLITINGNLRLEAQGSGGINAGGTGGTGLGGRASVLTENGGTVTITGDFTAFAGAVGGAGQTGGDGLAGLAGAQARIGTIGIGGTAVIDANATGGNADFGFGGNGGIGRGGNAFLQANGTLTDAATITVAGLASLAADGVGGTGGQSDSQAIAAGRGGFGYGGDSGNPNQADPTFNGGVYVLAGGDRGTIEVGSLSVQANGTGGVGGGGSDPIFVGAGGDGFGGLTQIGLALLGNNGSVGLGRASLGNVTAAASGFGGVSGRDGFDTRSGNGGNGTGGLAALTLRAGEVTATTISLVANGTGGEGTAGGTGTGGGAAILGGLGGTLTANEVLLQANGFGGFTSAGGNGVGGTATVEVDGTTITINGDLTVDASGRGGDSNSGPAGNGLGGEAFVGQAQSGSAGTLNVTGHTEIFANGLGGENFADFAGGNGQGGHAWVRASGGASVNFDSVQVVAIGRGGRTSAHEGGDGTGGLVDMIATGTNSRITVARNVPARTATDSPGGGAILDASGFGEETSSGDGIGGIGRGGTILVSAAQGGAVNLPVNIAADPASAEVSLIMRANGTGGDSRVDGGVGGSAVGGRVELIAQDAGSGITAGDTNLEVIALGGSGLDLGASTRGGLATGGQIRVTAQGGSALTFGLFDAFTSARGGDGTSDANGGEARGGSNLVTLNNATLNVTGFLGIYDEAEGGSGLRGGDANGAGEGVASGFSATNSTINLTPDAQGFAGIEVESAAFGGDGVTGGNAFAGGVAVTFDNTDLNQGILRVASVASGGFTTSSDGRGGNAVSRPATLTINNSTMFLSELVVTADAFGGDGGGETGGVGGEGTAGNASLVLTNSELTVQPVTATGLDSMRITAQGFVGQGFNAGNATGGQAGLRLTGSILDTAQLRISADTDATNLSGQNSGAATAGDATLVVEDGAELTAAIIFVTGSARSRDTGSTRGGSASLRLAGASSIDANDMLLNADGSGSSLILPSDTAGLFDVDIAGGSVNLTTFSARATGNVLNPAAPASRIRAVGGNLNVTGQLDAFALGDITVEHGDNGTIGSGAIGQIANTVRIESLGTLRITGIPTNPPPPPNQTLSAPTGGGLQSFSGATGGIRGQLVDLFAGRSIFLDGNVAGTDGAVTLTANRGGQPQSQPAPSVITMAQGALIDGGTGSVFITLLDGLSDPQRQTGAITLANIRASDISVTNRGSTAGSDITVRADGVLTASGDLRAISLASINGEVINLHGDAGLVLTGGGHYGIFAATPTGSQIGSPANYQRRYNVQTEQNYNEADPGGNYAAFRITPFLTVFPNSATRFYGDANPAFTAGFLGFLPGDSVADLTGAPQFLTAANGTSPVGLYTINAALGTLVSPQGYQFVFEPGVLSVTARPITITASNLSRIYGDANPALTFTVGGQGLVNGDQLGGALATSAGLTSGVGNYAITQGTLTANSNYAVTFVGGQLTVTPRPLTITANSFSRVYGNANPALTFVLGGQGLVNGDQLTGSLATTAGLTTGVGTYAITQGTLGAGANYAITFNAGQLTINPRLLTITADDLSRIYGNANPTLTFTVGGQGLVNGDQLTGALATVAGVTTGVGSYAITQGTLTAGANYTVTFDPGTLSITPRPITITASNLSRIYGNANPSLGFTVGGDGLVNGDQLAGALATTATVTSGVGNYEITQGTLAAGANYALTFNSGILSITPRPITVTANSLSRIYGNANPALTFTVNGGAGTADQGIASLANPTANNGPGLVNGDQLTGTLATTAGLTSGVGSYAITLGSLAANANYAITFVGGQLTVTPRPITVTASNLSRIYGNANPALTFTVGGQGLVNGDQLTGALATTAGATSGVGSYAINQGSLAAGANYTVTYIAGALSVTPRPITISADSFSRVYGNANPALTFSVGGLGLVNGDQLTGALAAAGVTAGVGTSAITLGTLSAGANYAITFNAGVLTITPRPLTVAADNLSKTLGLADPQLTFRITAGDLVNGDVLSGSLVRDPGESIASFVIRQGTLTAGANYSLTYVPGTFTINPPPVSPDINNPTSFEPPVVVDEMLPPVRGDSDQRFGIDFPEQPEAPLISEDPLLDDPVSSGGDSAIYGDDDDDDDEDDGKAGPGAPTGGQ